MTFTYDSTDLTTALAKVRMEIGDTDSASALFTDEEIQVKLDARSDNVLLAAADLCDALAARYARKPKFTTDNQSFDFTAAIANYRQMAATFRARATGGIISVGTKRIDGFSQDIESRDVLTTDTNPRRRYYGERDAPY